MNTSVALARSGFDLPRLRFALRTAVAACAALLVAWLLGLEHPQWSAMTVWVASQPTRGQLLEKSLFRVAGTSSGALFGIVLMVISRGDPTILVAGIAIWIALCAGIGNIQRGLIAYGTILAGYSASMVALLDSAHPDRVLLLGVDRLATILVGVLLALAVGLIFTPNAAEAEMAGRVRRLTASVLRDLAMDLGRDGNESLAVALHAVLAEMAAIEESLEPHGAGSLRSRRTVRAIRSLLMAQISLLLRTRKKVASPDPGEIVVALEAAASALESGLSEEDTLAAMGRLVGTTGSDPQMHEAVLAVVMAYRTYSALGTGRTDGERRVYHPVVLHRDWAGAWRTFMRAGITMIAVGMVWIATGWSAGPFLLLGVSVMTSIFSTFDNPARVMRFVFVGQVCGALGALGCRFLVWPLAGDVLEVLFMTMPFVLAAALFFSHRRTLPLAFDYAMVSLLLLHPAYPPTGTLPEMLEGALAVVSAPLIAMAAYRFIFPLDAGRRLNMLATAMVHELADMVRATDLSAHRLIWKARLYHRLLRLVSLAGKSGRDRGAVIDGALAILALGSAIVVTRDLLNKGDLPAAVKRSLNVALVRLKRVETSPGKTAASLVTASRRLSNFGMSEADTLSSAAMSLAANATFFVDAGEIP